MKFISAPYSNAFDKHARREAIARYSATLLESENVICPMTLGLALSDVNPSLPRDRKFWMDWALAILSKCNSMDVLCFPGWKESKGVREEIDFAKRNGIKINYVQMADFAVS